MFRASFVAIVVAGSALAAQATTSSALVSFDTGVQSLWGIGSPADFGAGGYVVGNNSLGISYAAAASSGSLQSLLAGTLTAEHDDQVGWYQRRRVSVNFGFSGDSAALLSTLAASIAVQAHLNQTLLGVPIAWNPTLLNRSYSLDIDQGFVPAMPQTVNAGDSFVPAAVRLDLPSFGLVLDGSAGVSLDVVQTATLKLEGLRGLVVATHRDSGEVVRRLLSFDEAMRFSLPLAGVWDFDARRLSLPNTFTTDFRLDIRGDIEFGLGTGCGNYGSDSDNGPFCIADERVARQLTGVELYTGAAMQLPYGSIDLPAMFSIEVGTAPGAVAAVPETGTAGMLLAGLALLAGLGRARQRRPSAGA